MKNSAAQSSFIGKVARKGLATLQMWKANLLGRPFIDLGELGQYFANRRGLEIGGPSGFFKRSGVMPLYDIVGSLDGVNYAASTIWTGAIDVVQGFRINGKVVGTQYIADAVDLSALAKNSYDFVLSCHNIEHIANPMKAVEQWLDVLKPGGVLVIVAPRKEANFDHKREIVKFEHLVDDYRNDTTEADLTHLPEILQLHDLELDPPAGTPEQFKERSLKNFENRCLHHHVFDLAVLRRICEYFELSVLREIEIPNDSNVVIARKPFGLETPGAAG